MRPLNKQLSVGANQRTASERTSAVASLHPRIPFCPPPKPTVSAHFAELLKPVPQPCRSYEDWHVYRHLDLCAMTPAELEGERAAVEARIAYERHSHAWLFDRLSRVRALLPTTEGAIR